MFSFNFHVPTKLIFENGGLTQLGKITRVYGDRALLVMGRSSMQNLGVLDEAADILNEAGVETCILDGVKSNPTADSVYAGAEEVKNRKLNVIVGLGGGSVLDAARAISLAATHEGDFWEYRITGTKSVGGIKDIMIPVVTVPTTAGTGNEISPATLIAKATAKEVFYSPYMFPKAAITDPSLAVTVPPQLSVQIGIDAFVQGMEAYVSSAATPFSDMFASGAMRIAVESLKEVFLNGQDLDARANLALSAILSMFAVNQAGVGAVHALSDPLSGRYDIHHGLALSIVLAEVMEFNCDSNPQKYARIAGILGADISTLPANKAARKAATRANALVRELGLAHTLRDFGISEADIPVFAQEAQNPDMSTNPKKMTNKDIENIYKKVL